ncbi:MAG TPA: bifunctional alpha,alpha-trehalose-phosphate synthase (UDP-forming)/trehalose-phosphatase [Elusimicrobia bacterium]|nr:bifunctional alpha,alpha-trehalose-phosphate synthase (UDP-forming)/trehalose-phosphatase [Elusimicrobiota bacterium]
MRLVIVSNRLPFVVVEKEGKLKFKESAGGLASGLSAYLNYLKSSPSVKEYLWIGWPGVAVENGIKEKLKSKAVNDFNAYPVFLSEKTMEKFYNGFCNKTIWPLFHYFPSYVLYDEDLWNCYKEVNETFCEAITQILQPDDMVWIHDYHLLLLPKLLREKMSEIPIGFFLHIPFPDCEIFRLLPRKWAKEILNGILGADLIGFHTHDYTQYFLRSVLRILGYEHNLGQIVLEDRMVKVETFPMGIDFHKFYNSAGSSQVEKEKDEFKKILGNSEVVLSLDRLDYTKGIINRLEGFELFLKKNPHWHRKVVLLLIVVPSRVGVEKYQEMKNRIDELAGRINGEFGSIGWTPIIYQYRHLPFHTLVALYTLSRVALITPLRDGMNLVAKEYIATRTDKTGVLILSEMAGASKELGEAVIINPNHREEIAEAIKEALEMPQDEQVRRNQIMQKRLESYNVIRWANDFTQEILSLKEEQKKFSAKLLTPQIKEKLIRDFGKAQRRLIFLDYDGTLVPFAPTPQMARPDEEVLMLLKRFSADSKNEVVLASGRERHNLQEWFGNLNLDLVAEHGVWIKGKNEEWKLIKPLTSNWRPQILPLLKRYVDRLPGSFVEEKDYSLVWHYRRADPELSSIRAKELMDDLVNFTANIDVQVLQGSKVVEIRCAGVNKGTAGMYFLSKDNFDFILAIGDDWTDEDLFKVLPETAYSIKVGLSSSYAKFNLRNYGEVRHLLAQLIKE